MVLARERFYAIVQDVAWALQDVAYAGMSDQEAWDRAERVLRDTGVQDLIASATVNTDA